MPHIETFRAFTIGASTFIAVVMLAAIIIGIMTDKRTKNSRPVILRSNFPVL
jgi:hypothetical protein